MPTPNPHSATSRSRAAGKNAIALLKADHEMVKAMFAEYQKLRSPAKKKTLAEQICTALTVHAQIEEELFYPEVKAVLRDKDLVPEALIEHGSVKDLIGKLQDLDVEDEMYDATVRVLSEFVKHHVKEEQNEMFPKVRETSLDLTELGERLAARKAELLANHH